MGWGGDNTRGPGLLISTEALDKSAEARGRSKISFRPVFEYERAAATFRPGHRRVIHVSTS